MVSTAIRRLSGPRDINATCRRQADVRTWTGDQPLASFRCWSSVGVVGLSHSMGPAFAVDAVGYFLGRISGYAGTSGGSVDFEPVPGARRYEEQMRALRQHGCP